MAQCPICKKETDPKIRPFCSQRCKEVDLNRWFNGSYSIPLVSTDEDEDFEEE